jgi:hypothetical protein
MSRISSLLPANHTINGTFSQGIPPNGVVYSQMHVHANFFFVHIDGKSGDFHYHFSPLQTNINKIYVNL